MMPPEDEEVDGREEEPEFEALLDPLLDAYDMDLELPDPDPEPIVDEVEHKEEAPLHMPPPSPGAVDPPPPPEPVEAPAKRRRAKTGLEISVALDKGTITYFPSNGNFQATCLEHAAERCTLSRKGHDPSAAGSSARPPCYRPLGLLAAWLEISHIPAEKEVHKDAGNLKRLASPVEHQFRIDCRRQLLEIPGSEALFAHETPAGGEAGFASEPEQV